jgi:hypothetical protein
MRRLSKVFARAGARVDVAFAKEFAPGFEVVRASLALHVWSERTADVGSFVPFDSEPAEIFMHRSLELGTRAIRVEIFVAKDQRSAATAGALIGSPKSAGVTEMQVSRR